MSAALFDLDRPTYSVPSMAEIRERDNGLTAVSTFSGCGGSSTGLHMAGFRVPYAAEFIPAARETYQANWPDAYVDPRDVREIQADEILARLGLQPGELDLFEGSPPCSSFSSAAVAAGKEFADRVGKVKQYSGNVHQRTDDLFEEWVRLVAGIMPKAIIAENVPDLAQPGSASDYLHMILGQLKDLGYGCHARVYSSLQVGCATSRRRLVIMGMRKDVGAVPIPHLTGSGYTLREGLETLPVPIPKDELGESFFDGSGVDSVTGRQLPRYQIADHWECIRPGQVHGDHLCKHPDPETGKRPMLFSLTRTHWDRPVPTIIAKGAVLGHGNASHPDEPRSFTATELKWLSGFPADYILTGNPRQRYERIGRAVTPPLYEALGGHLARALKEGS